MTSWNARPVAERFAEKFEVDPVSGCWLWTAKLSPDGYGQIRERGKHKQAHRVAYELHRGEIPAGLQIDHLCRVRHCVNPDHLEPVTQLENARRGHYRMRTHCPQGHAYDETNTYIRPNGRRTCRACNLASALRLAARKRGAA
jgi:hypothetical protein